MGKKILLTSLTGVLAVGAVLVRPTVVVGLVILALVLGPLEAAFALHRRSPFRRGWRTDVTHFVVNSLLTNAGVIVVVVVLGLPARALTPDLWRASIAALPGWMQFVTALGIVEVVAYWGHRAAHQVPVLWRFHKVHHASAQLDWLAAAHLHPVDQIFVRSAAILPLVVLGFSRGTFGAYLAFATFQAIFVHANVRFTFGPLRWLIATPEYHHWHHANEPAYRDRNFAGFPLVDRLFGTLHLPARWPTAYGIDEPQPDEYLAQLQWSFR